ncbi:glycoside hydrolase superfamily [Suillus bovinus]|uniref:glycoside hydrolase superfamily n=1 Tax=Suillus bovinus TaxID=48563 RepID=UPI001B8773D1|nr:glycoside hydrolase superfamily [Suillus bovinus]KAG2129837.1 glycoside hydrolase superfamily [Suillus bovinus]
MTHTLCVLGFLLLLSLDLISARHVTRSCHPHSSRSSGNSSAHPLSGVISVGSAPPPAPATSTNGGSSCFPSAGFVMPSSVPSSTNGWWCSPNTEYAFLGFSYEVSACQSASKLNSDFADIKHTFGSRYVRLYGACDRAGFYDDIVDAAWASGLGVHALIWFGFDGGDQWMARRDSLVSSLTSNPKAKFVTRGVQFGSEPLFDNVLPHEQLAAQVISLKSKLRDVGIPVTVSELAYGYQERGGAQDVLDAIDFINIHMLPFFSALATFGAAAWPLLEIDMNWFIEHGNGKKMYFDENGWPSVTSPGVQANSILAQCSVANEEAYFSMLDSHCEDLKLGPQGGIGWFAHIYSDEQEPGYGIYDDKGNKKFPFKPRTSC